MKNFTFIQEHYGEQIGALNSFIADAYKFLPNQDYSTVRFGGGTALAIYYFQHRLSFDIDLFVTDVQILNYLSPKHWIDETNNFDTSKYIDLSHHIRVLEKKNNIKVDVLVTQNKLSPSLLDDSKIIFDGDIYVESIEDIIAKKIMYRKNDNLTRDIIDIAIAIKHTEKILESLLATEKINKQDIKDLFQSLQQLDTQSFHDEIEIVAPFQKYIDDANNAPEIIMQTCKSLLAR